MSVHPRVVNKRRQSLTALPLYHSGHLQKKHGDDQDFTRFYAELRGSSLFLYRDDTQVTYSEKLDLELLKSMKLESPYKSKTPTVFNLSLHNTVVQLKMDNADTGELWRGYILTVAHREIPSQLQLLPGQMVQLQEALDLEKSRNPTIPRPPLPRRPAFLQAAGSGENPPAPPGDGHDPGIPACFFNVTRQEAERMLELNPECGGIILRPATMANNYALTIRQMTPRGPSTKNFRVSSTSAGFVIELDTPVAVPTLNEALQYFIEKMEYRLLPYKENQPYDTNIGKLPPAPKFISATSTAGKKVPKAQVAPMRQPQIRKEFPPLPDKPEEENYLEADNENLETGRGPFQNELQEVLTHRRNRMKSQSEQEEQDYVNPLGDTPAAKTMYWN